MPASPAEAAPPPARARHVGRSARMSRWLEVVTVACLSVTSSGAASTTPSTSSRPLLATELPPMSLEPAESLGNRAPWRGADGGGRALRVCTTGDYPPLTSYDPSTEEFSGLAPSILRQFGSMYNYSITFVLTTWDAMHADLTNGTRCDLAAGGIDTEDRRSRFGVSVPVLTYKKVPLFSKENEAVFQTLDDINRTGVTILECEGSANEVFVRELQRQGILSAPALEVLPSSKEVFACLEQYPKLPFVRFLDSTEMEYRTSLEDSGLSSAGADIELPERLNPKIFDVYLADKSTEAGRQVLGDLDRFLMGARATGLFEGWRRVAWETRYQGRNVTCPLSFTLV